MDTPEALKYFYLDFLYSYDLVLEKDGFMF